MRSMARMRRAVRWTLALVTLIAIAGVSSSGAGASSKTTSGAPGATSAIPAFYVPPRPLPVAPPGTLIRSTRVTGVPGVPAGATVWRILFHSTTIYGADLAESGYVIAPGAPPPATGYPVIAWAHGTTGFAARCAPSLFTNAGGGNGPYLIPGLANYLRAGFVVTAADYQGLGVADGVHPYLLGDSEGRSVLDATRASRHLPGLRTSDTVVVYGHSQGGHAALFAGEMAPTYAPDLHVVGVVAAAPATGLSTLISIVATSTGQQFLPFSIPTSYAWSQTYNDLPITDVFTATGEQFAREEVTKGCLDSVANAIGRRHLTPGQVFLPSSETNPIVIAHAKANDPGRVRTTVPMLILQGTKDMTVPPGLTDAFVSGTACKIGDTVEYLHVMGATHNTVVLVGTPSIVRWMQGRILGSSPASTTCGRPHDLNTLGR